MGTDKNPNQRLLNRRRWGAALFLTVIAVWRGWNYELTQPQWAEGQSVKVKMRFWEEVEKESIRLGKLKIYWGGRFEAKPGCLTEIAGRVEPGVITEFDYQYALKIATFKQFDCRRNWRTELFALRQKIKELWQQWLPGDEGGLVAGILVGGQEGMSPQTGAAFRIAGISHVLAASGYNLTIAAGWGLNIAVRKLSRRWAIWFGILCMFLYIFLAGAGAAVVRAAIMMAGIFLALIAGRPGNSWWLWRWTVLTMLAVNPGLRTDIGWQLSAAATAGLIWGNKKWGLNQGWGGWKTTAAAQLATLPIILHQFGYISLWALPVNLAVLWMVPLIMQLGAWITLGGIVWSSLGQAGAYLVWPPAWGMIKMAEWAGRIEPWKSGFWGWEAGVVWWMGMWLWGRKRK